MNLAPQAIKNAAGQAWRKAGCVLGIGAMLGMGVAAAVEPAAAGTSASSFLPGLPLSFEANQGQADDRFQFLARGRGHNFFLAPTEAVVVLSQSPSAPEVYRRRAHRAGRTRLEPKSVRFRLVDADPGARMRGCDLLSGKVNYLIGPDPLQWRSGIPTFQKVQVSQAYPGVDVVYYASGQRLEYDFHLAPGADPEAILLQIDEADRVWLGANGNLIVEAGGQRIYQHRPVAYQLDGSVRRTVKVAYRLTGERTLRFQLGHYDRGLPLVIDPVLSYSTYLGGSKQETGWDLALDGSGNVYVAGETLSTQLTTTPGAFQTNYAGGTKVGGDAFVAKLDATGSNLVYLTYLGGGGDDAALSIAVDGGGNAYLTGFTDSPNFPLASAIITNLGGRAEPYFDLYPFDAFVTKLNADGAALVYSTYLGGSTNDEGIAIAVDSGGSAYVTGFTDSRDFPLVNALQATNAGFDDVFVTKVASDGSAFQYSTYLGGANIDQGEGIAVDTSGRAWVTGFTQSTNFPTANAMQPWLAGGQDAFVTVLAPDGSGLVQSTYIGSVKDEIGFRITLDATGASAYVTGSAQGFSFPVMVGEVNGGGVIRSDDGGATWSGVSAGLRHVNVHALAMDPMTPAKMYAGTGHGVARSSNGGGLWETAVGAAPTSKGLAPAIAVDGVSALAIDPVSPATVYAGTAGAGVFKSVDGGVNWSLSSTGLVNLSLRALAIDPLSPTTIYAGTAGGVYRSTNGAGNWKAYNSGLGNVNVQALAVNPATPSTLYAATASGVYRSMNRATNWAAINNGLTNRSTLSLVIDPATPSTVYVGTASGLFKSTNAGTNWNGLHVAAGVSNFNSLAIDPQAPSTIYVGSSRGLFRSTDGGGSWALRAEVFPVALAIHPQTGAVFAGAFGVANFGGKDAYVLKWNGELEYSVVFGGTSDDEGWDVDVDGAGNAYVAGATFSTNFPVAQPVPFQSKNRGRWDAFVTAVDPLGTALVYSTYLGGRSNDLGFGIEVDLGGTAYVVGQTVSTNFPVRGAPQPVAGGLGDAFVAKLIIIPPPTLSVSRSDTNVILSWPAEAFGYVLQCRTNLTTNSWLTVTNVPVLDFGSYSLTLGATNQSRFFRLLSP